MGKGQECKDKKRFSMYNLPISHRGLASDSIKISGSLCFLFNTIFIPPSRPFAASTGGRTYLCVVFGHWIQPIHSCRVQVTTWVGQEAKSQPGDTPRPWEKWTDPDVGCRDQQNPLVDAVFVINDIPPKPRGTGLWHQRPARGHLLWCDLSSLDGNTDGQTQLPQHCAL